MDRPLPHIDEHGVEIAAPADRVWPELWKVVSASFSGDGRERIARALGCQDARSERSVAPEQGTSLAGFRVVAADAPSRLILEGAHRFSRYRLGFHLDPVGSDRVRLRARTDAGFPGLAGRVYRALVIGTRGHVLAVRRILRAVKSRAERPA